MQAVIQIFLIFARIQEYRWNYLLFSAENETKISFDRGMQQP